MSEVLVFTPKHKLELAKNLDDFIEFAKNELTLFDDQVHNSPNGLQKGWDCDKWSWQTKRGKKLTIVFGKSENHSKYTPFQQPFSDFAKAYVRYMQSLNQKDSVMWASSLVWLHDSLEEFSLHNKDKSIDVMNVNNAVINRVEELIRKSDLSDGGKRNIALSLENVLKFVKEKRFKIDIQDWSNPFPRPSDTRIKVSKKSQEKEQDKCPSDFQMLQVADAFYKAKTHKQKYFSSLCVMLMCQPSRNEELNALTINSLQVTDSGRWYLMWHPAKGGDPVRKWVPKLLEDVVQQAFDRLVAISEPARIAAKFAFDNPDSFMLHSQCITPKTFPLNHPLTYDQFAKAMGFKTGKSSRGADITWVTYGNNTIWLKNLISTLNGVSDWKKELCDGASVLSNNEVVDRYSKEPTGVSIKFPSYADLRDVVHKQYKSKTFPNYGDIKIWDCVTLVRDNEFHKEFEVKPFSWVPVGHGMLSDAIGSERGNEKVRMQSIFEELGIKDEDGAPLRLTSHQFRHWLNTKLKLAGEEDWLIAKWSGRADLEQNKAYDGRTEEQKSRLTKRIGQVTTAKGVMTVAQANQFLSSYTSESPPPAIVLHDLGLPISLKSLGVSRKGVGLYTGLGYCVHNYAESPCIKNGDCSVCSEHVCLKGLPHSLEELQNLEKLYQEQLEDAKIKAQDSVFGADRWVTAIGFRLSKIRTIIAMLNDPNREVGSPVRVPDALDPSPIKRSFNIDEQNVIPTLDLTALALSDLSEG